MAEQTPYPAHWEADVVLRDGATAHLRPVRPTDQEALATMYAGQSERTIYLRFFTYKSALSAKELVRFTTVDHQDRVAFVIMLGEEMIGIGRFDRTGDPTEAEVAFFISDAHHGRGIGSILLEHLAAAGRERGIRRFSAEVLPENRKMLNVFSDAGYELSRGFDDGVIMVHFDIDPTERSRSVMESREHRAEAKSVATLVAPRAVAVIGASREWHNVGHEILENIIEGGFTGPVYGVNPEALEIGGMKAHARIEEVPEPVDLAIIAVPIDEVSSVVRQCGRAGVRGVLIVTSGYADDGARGRARQQKVVRIARDFGMRVIGPASLGLVNTDPQVRLMAGPGSFRPLRGGMGKFSQSAAIGVLMYSAGQQRGIGVSSMLSAGNRADVSGNDMMQYWEDDAATRVCGLYLESIGNPRKFSRIARRLARTKPVIVAKSEVTGMQLPPGHSGRTSSAPPEALNEMFRQAGVIRAQTSEHMMDIAQILTAQPLPKGRRTVIFSNAFALSQVIKDACSAHGVEVRRIDAAVAPDPEEKDPAGWLSARLLEHLRSPDVDVAIAAFLPSALMEPEEIAHALMEAAVQAEKPVLASFTGLDEGPGTRTGILPAAASSQAAAGGRENPSLNAPPSSPAERPAQAGLPCFESPGAAVAALGEIITYVEWRSKEETFLEEVEGTDAEAAQTLIDEHAEKIPGEGLLRLDQEQASQLLASYGIEVLPSVAFTTADEAVQAAERLGYPVAVKTTDSTMRHRLDLGGVRLGIEDEQSLRRDIDLMHRTLKPYGSFDLEVQAMAPTGQNCVIRAIEDPLLGPVISFGMAGDSVTLLDDWAHRVPPLTERDVRMMVRAPKASRKLFGYEGLPPVNVPKLEQLLRRVAQMKDAHPQIARLELHPVMISPRTLTILAAEVELGNPQRRTDSARRTMSQ